MAASSSSEHAGDDLGNRATPLSGTQLDAGRWPLVDFTPDAMWQHVRTPGAVRPTRLAESSSYTALQVVARSCRDSRGASNHPREPFWLGPEQGLGLAQAVKAVASTTAMVRVCRAPRTAEPCRQATRSAAGQGLTEAPCREAGGDLLVAPRSTVRQVVWCDLPTRCMRVTSRPSRGSHGRRLRTAPGSRRVPPCG